MLKAERRRYMRQLLTKKEILTIPNALSMVRILLIPLFIWLYVKRLRIV